MHERVYNGHEDPKKIDPQACNFVVLSYTLLEPPFG